MRTNQRRLPLWMTLGATLMVAGLNFYWCVAYAGPFRWFAELQIYKSSRYSPEATMFLTVLASAVPTLALLLLLSRLGLFDRLATEADRAGRRRPWLEWCVDHLVALLGTAAAAGLFFVGLWHFVEGCTMGPLTLINASELEKGSRPPSRWAEVTGRFLPGAEVKKVGAREDPRFQTRHQYYPLVSAHWKAGDPVAVVVKMPHYLTERRVDFEKVQRGVKLWLDRLEAEAKGWLPPGEQLPGERDQKQDLDLDRLKTGTLSAGSLPGIALTGLEKSGYRLASPYYVLNCMGSPDSEKGFGKTLMALGLAVGTITGIASAVSAWRARRRQSAIAPANPFFPNLGMGDVAAPHVKLGADGRDGIMFRT
jgi:hypothetical protein